MAEPTDRPIVPIPASDPLLVDTLRAGLESYIRGDYRRGAALFLDASAISGYRPEAEVWALLGMRLEHALDTRVIVSRDAAEPTAQAVPR